MEVKGTFKVKISPVEGTALENEAGVGRMTIDKVWQGDLEGTSKGVMLTCATESTGSMAYVALEKFEGRVNGKAGAFYFTHNASMQKGKADSGVQNIRVVADSGTDELAGISGNLTINIDANGGHAYVFDYELD